MTLSHCTICYTRRDVLNTSNHPALTPNL